MYAAYGRNVARNSVPVVDDGIDLSRASPSRTTLSTYSSDLPKPEVAVRLEPKTRDAMLAFRMRRMPEWARAIVSQVSQKHGISVEDIASPSRTRLVRLARDEAIYEVKRARPSLTSTPLAQWFARDHTSIFFSMAKHQEATGLPPLTTYDLEGQRQRNARKLAKRASA